MCCQLPQTNEEENKMSIMILDKKKKVKGGDVNLYVVLKSLKSLVRKYNKK